MLKFNPGLVQLATQDLRIQQCIPFIQGRFLHCSGIRKHSNRESTNGNNISAIILR